MIWMVGEITGVSRFARRNSDKRRKFRAVGEILKLRQGGILKMVDWRSLTLFPRSLTRKMGERRRRLQGEARVEETGADNAI